MPTEREKQAEQAVLNGLVLINGGNNNTAGDNTNTAGNIETTPVGDGSTPIKTGDAGVAGLTVLALLSAGALVALKKRNRK